MAAFSLILDMAMTFLLAGTIWFVWRLSEQLARFRSYRQDMDRLVRELLAATERAQVAIAGLKEAASTSGDTLQRIMRQASEISDELQLMTESGNALAERLQNLATNRGGAAQRIETMPPPATTRSDRASAFSIRDPDFAEDSMGNTSAANDADEWNGVEDLRSAAEKELFKAVQQNKKNPRSLM